MQQPTVIEILAVLQVLASVSVAWLAQRLRADNANLKLWLLQQLRDALAGYVDVKRFQEYSVAHSNEHINKGASDAATAALHASEIGRLRDFRHSAEAMLRGHETSITDIKDALEKMENSIHDDFQGLRDEIGKLRDKITS